MLALFTRMARYIYLRKGFGDLIEDGETGRPIASTLWLPSGETKNVSLYAEFAGAMGMLRDGGIKSLTRGFALDRTLTSKHPAEPHYYLFSIATDPQFRGMAFGGQVLRPALERCDREGMPAFLENSKERNIPFYMAHGFEITEEVSEPIPGCPPMWMMYRKPR